MPHILIKQKENLCVPCSVDDVSFDFIAEGFGNTKIGVSIDDKDFLITLKKNDDNTHLVKYDSPTRLSPVSIVKQALSAYAKITKSEILFSNITSKYNKIESNSLYVKTIDYFLNSFNEEQKDVIVEVGFGSGRHLIYQALKNPDCIIIGLEIHTPSIESVSTQLKLQNIDNVLLINYDARLFLECVKSNSAKSIFVHFPVPWDKKEHRRVMNDDFITQSLRALKIDGTLELRTDSIKYFEYSKGLLDNFKQYKHIIKENENIAVSSKYEDRWTRQGKDIWDIIMISNQNDKEISPLDNFVFDGIFDDKKLDTIGDKSNNLIIQKDIFVNFKSAYKISSTEYLVQVIFGNFEKPMVKYVYCSDKKINYFQGEPIKTRSNLQAHKIINEQLSKAK